MVKLFIFHRDLRVVDNTTLNQALSDAAESGETVLQAFIFTPEQVSDKNDYRSKRAIAFMIKSLTEIRSLHCYYGDTNAVVEHLSQKLDITGVYFNKDHTHYAIQRDAKLEQLCAKLDIPVVSLEDYNLHPMGSVQTGTGRFYSVYTPFKNKALTFPVQPPQQPHRKMGSLLYSAHVPSKYAITLAQAKSRFGSTDSQASRMLVSGGRSEANALLSKVRSEQRAYHSTRNDAAMSTTLLSAHIKFGTMSIREAYYAFKQVPNARSAEALVSQLLWNDFYDQLMKHLPAERTIGGSNYKQLHVAWETNEKHFEAWKKGTTGFPFIDAGMRQLNRTGYMHNRARMAVANYLAMTLLIDWRKGEKYFATQLVDYDVSQNNGNWQWSCGVGVDRTGYLRMFNPFSQSEKHDSQCEYIRQWVPELDAVPNEDIHKWDSAYKKHPGVYIKPIVDYPIRRKIAVKAFT